MTQDLKLAVVALAIAFAGAFFVTAERAEALQAEDEVASAVDAVFDAFNQGDIDAFVGLFTDAGLVAFASDPGEPLSPEEARAEIEGFIGLITLELLEAEVESAEVDSAIVRVRYDAGGQQVFQTWQLVRTNDQWLVDAVTNDQPEVPDGYEPVPVQLFEYGFEFDQSLIGIGDRIAFEATNVGQEAHEIVFARVPADLDLEAAFGSPDPPEGVVDLAFTFTGPGESGVALVEGPITPGRYVMLCFVPDPQGTPHVASGMVAEFTIEEAAPAPPATGTGFDGDGRQNSWRLSTALTLAVVVVILSASVARFFGTRRTMPVD